MVSILFLFPCVILFSLSLAQYFNKYELYNAKTGRPIRNLTDFDIITETVPLAIVVRTGGNPKSVTFTSPMFRRSLRPPYSLSAKMPDGTFRPLSLPPGEHIVSAFLNNEKRFPYTIRFQVQADFPKFGPLPSQVVPKSLPSGDLPIPKFDPTCKRKGPPGVFIEEISLDHVELAPNDRDIEYSVLWCDGHRVRIRFIEWHRSRDGMVRTTVFKQRQLKYHQLWQTRKTFRCKLFYFFIETCVMKSEADGEKTPWCGTSRLKYLPSQVAPEPGLVSRPPFFIKLAPGDSIKLKTRTNRASDENNINQVYDDDGSSRTGIDVPEKQVTNLIRGVFELRNGTKSFTPWTTKKSVSIRIPQRKGGLTSKENGSLVYLSYSTTSCKSSTNSWKGLWDTKLLVSKKHGSLVKQDITFPTFEEPTFPPTRFDEPAEITVEAKNPGGGMREGGKSVELHYQWYLETQSTIYFKDGPKKIAGATQKTLKIEKAKCNVADCGVSGCSGWHRYYVDVCNTFGCRRSNVIFPSILPPADIPEGKKWDHVNCIIVNKRRKK